MNNRDATIAGLRAVGYVRIPASTRKYILFGRPDIACHYLVGKSGALRKKKCDDPVSSSSSLTGGRFHRALREVGASASCYSSASQAQAHLMEALKS